MKQFIIFIAILLSGGMACAGVLRCSAEVNGAKHFVDVRYNDVTGALEKWDSNRLAAAISKKSMFSGFSEPLDQSAIESYRFRKFPNGYRVIEVFTTADAFTLGISSDKTRGFYKYSDLGSGNGNHTYELQCISQ